MSKSISLGAAVLTAVIAGPFAAAIGDTPPTTCMRTAEQLFDACGLNAEASIAQALAACRNLPTAGASSACRMQARADRRKDLRGCDATSEERQKVCTLLGEDKYATEPLSGVDIDGNPLAFVDPATIGAATPPNPYLSLAAGTTSVLRGGVDPGDTIVVHVTENTREVHGVSCRVVVTAKLSESTGQLATVAVTDNWYAQADTGDIYNCGAQARNFSNGVLRNLDGSFEAGVKRAKAGLLIRANPSAGEAHRQEYALDAAEDVLSYVSNSAAPGSDEGGDHPDAAFSCEDNGGCLQTEVFVPLEPGDGGLKYYLDGVGFVVGVAMRNGVPTGEREELVCTGSSLSVLDTSACGLADATALRAELCRQSPDAFCE